MGKLKELKWIDATADLNFEGLSMVARAVELTLVSADGCTGRGVYEKDGTHKGLIWSEEPKMQTDGASLDLYLDGVYLCTKELSGDEWRDFENSGLEEFVISSVLSGLDFEEAFTAFDILESVGMSIKKMIGVVLKHGTQYATEAAAVSALAQFTAGFESNELWIFGVDKNTGFAKDIGVEFASPIEFAIFAEKLHLALLMLKDEWYATRNEEALGSLVVALCEANGIDLLDDNGYCLKASPAEVCKYNLERMGEAVLAA